MLRKVTAAAALLCLLAALLCGCTRQEPITQQAAVESVLEYLEVSVEEVGSFHLHEGSYDGKDCYNVYLTYNGHTHNYVVDKHTGEVLAVLDGAHSH